MFEEMERDPAVVVIGEDVGVYGGASRPAKLLERFGWERVIDTPSAKRHHRRGLRHELPRPAPHLRDAVHRLYRLLFQPAHNFVAKGHYLWNAPAPIVVRGPSGGGVHGGPFHSANPEMYFVHTPGLKVILSLNSLRRQGFTQGRGAR